MSPSERKNDPISPGLEPYCTTHWSVVLLAGEEATPLATEALETLCQIYRYPLYAYLRRLSYSPHDAQNLTRDLFTYRILASGSEDKTVKLWDFGSRRQLANLKFDDAVRLVAFSPDGNNLAVVTDKGTLRLLRAVTLAEADEEDRTFYSDGAK